MQIHIVDPGVRLPQAPRVIAGTSGQAPVASGHTKPRELSTPLSSEREFSQLVELAREQPEVRRGLVDRVKAGLERGEYFTRRAAEETAAKFLGMDAFEVSSPAE